MMHLKEHLKMIYVALLRGINVGGKNKIDMKQLKKSFESISLEQVATYINTGNIIFSDNIRSIEQISREIENVIQADFSLNIKVMVKSIDEIKSIISALPEHWTNDDAMKSDVLFLWSDVDSDTVLQQLPISADIDHIIYVPGALLWSCDREKLKHSGMSKIVGTKFYQLVTIRNVNTARKLYALMQNSIEPSI